jgi:ABC-2 type transport system permease protein
MRTQSAIAKKELRTYFLSPIALIFIATFLLASLFSFFWVEGFFARNVADVRPLFVWLPVLLAFLVPALGMRLWSEEERTGTLELLRTWPLATRALVLGKFVSALGLVAVALFLTLPVPLTVAFLGKLDWGPVFGGYVATLLVAAAYLSVALCISAVTPNQIVSLVFGVAACAGLYLLGAEPVASLFGNFGGEVLRGLGAGSRFTSILRGVLDLRDVTYYASLTFFFLLLNITVLDAKRWSRASGRSGLRFHRLALVALAGANLVALNIMLAPVRGARLDLTADREYSISPVTKELLAGLQEPLVIRGYFSGKTHPLLAPLVPRIRDLIEEYGAVGGEKVKAEFVDPTTDAEIEKEASQAYGIKSVPFQFADRHEASVVNSYFHVLVRYGDQFETLGFEDLIEIQVHGMDIEVRLRNLEYDLTRAVQKAVYGFTSIESVVARLPAPAKLRVVVTPDKLPEGFADIEKRITKVAQEIASRSGERFTFEEVDPTKKDATLTPEVLAEKYKIKPMAMSLFSDETFYLNMLLEVGDHYEQLVPPESLTEADIKEEIIAGLKRAGPGSLKTIGFVAEQESMGMPGMPEAGPNLTFNRLREALAQTYQVKDVDLKEGRVPGDVDVLLVLGPKNHSELERYALDQFLMRGGSAIVLGGSFVIDPSSREQLLVSKVSSGLDELLATYGIRVGKEVVLDPQAGAFPIPVTRDLGGFVVHDIQMLPYPAFVDVRGDGFDSKNPAVAGLPSVVLHWPSVVEATPAAGASSENATSPAAAVSSLLWSTNEAWLLDDFKAEPDFSLYPEVGWPVRGERKRFSLAAARMGPLTSYFKGKDAPVLGGSKDPATDEPGDNAAKDPAKDKTSQRRGAVVESSPDRSRLVVVGSATFVSDFAVSLSRQISDAHLANFALVNNLVDWCLEDVALLGIRARGTYARTLVPTSSTARQALEWGNYAFAVLAVLVIGFFSMGRRKQAVPMALTKPVAHASDIKEVAA